MTPFLGHCDVSRGEDQMRLVAAAFCADRPEFEALVGAALAAQGYRLDWAEDVLPAGPWVARHPAAGGAELARSVHAGRRVALGPMMALAALGEAGAAPDQNWLQVEELGPVEPLDAQFGVHPKKSAPDALRDALFGQPEPSDAEREAFGDTLPLLATYAVLDAAKMPYLLTSLLESSGLRYQSLFQGAAQEDLGEHAPYLVELCEDNDFTRRLFTGPDGIGGLWVKDLGIFIRSRAGFDALRKHLRKFTRVQDEEGKWFYFRFWDHPVSTTALSLGNRPELSAFVSSFFADHPSLHFVIRSGFGSWLDLRVQNPAACQRSKSVMSGEVRSFMQRIRQVLEFESIAAKAVASVSQSKDIDQPAAMKALRSRRDVFVNLGFWRRDHMITLCIWELMLGPDFFKSYADGRVARVFRQGLAPHEVIDAITEILEERAGPQPQAET